ncbi:hypothetical protein BHM03_00062701 [Ensete ventricosum]|nr:hypothetical protein BHM03_00062701 [Ensete ventricosum]
MPDTHPTLAIQAFLMGLRPSWFFWSLIERPLSIVPEMLQRASQYVTAESLVAGKRENHKKSRGDKPQGQSFGTPRRRDRPELPAPRPLPISLNLTRTEDPRITFREGDDVYLDHDDALVISAQITNTRVKRVMVDMGISPAGTTVLPITIGEEPRSKTLLVSFVVVALPSAYNTIIGRPMLNKLRAVVSMYHRVMKFLTRAGVGEVRSDPRESRQCDLTAITLPKKLKVSPPTHGI